MALYVDRMQQLSAQLGELRGEDAALLASMSALAELQQVEREGEEQKQLIARLGDEIRREEADLEFGRSRVA